MATPARDAAAVRRSYAAEDKLLARLREVREMRRPHLRRVLDAHGYATLPDPAVRRLVGA